MAATLLKLKSEDGASLMLFKTSIVEGIIFCAVGVVDEDLNAISKTTAYEVKTSEEEYHTELRAAAAIESDLITSLSTNPEWNPEGYVKTLDNNS